MPQDLKTSCPYCGVGCGLVATSDGRRVIRVRGDKDHPANFGKLCSKGATVGLTVNTTNRLRYTMVREPGAKAPGGFQIVPAATAIHHAAERLEHVLQTYGPGAIAFYLSGQLTTEAQYVANKFAKAYLRTNHVDSNSRLCMAGAASGMNLSLGSDGPPTCYADIELAETFFFIGSNAAECHPVTFERVAKQIKKGARCVVVDPRRTPTAEAATVHLPIKPGTDLTLLNGLLRLFRDWGKLDSQFIAEHTEGWEAMDALFHSHAPEVVAAACGVPLDDFLAAARILAEKPKLITFWTMGVNQNLTGTFAANAIINLHLATGRIGKPGAGPFSLTGQPNAMGGRDVGYMSHTLPGYRFVADPKHRADVEQFWGLKPGTIYPHPGYDAVQMFDAIERGEIKAVWIIGSNPAASMPNLPKIRRALEKAELVIVQDAYYPTETTQYAHVVLPAAVNLEQSATMCNSERRVTLMEQVVAPPGDAQPDWYWVKQVAEMMGFTAGLKFSNAAEIYDEFARCTAGRPNDQSGLYYDVLRARGPQQWPYPAMARPSERRYADRVFHTPTGRGRFFARVAPESEERLNDEFPLILTTGRTLNQWHTRTKTGNVEGLNTLDPAPFLEMHPDDAARLRLGPGQRVEVVSRRGRALSVLRVDADVTPGVVFLPIHWNELWGPSASPNEATSDEVDPVSKQPALKCCAVAVRAYADDGAPEEEGKSRREDRPVWKEESRRGTVNTPSR